MTSAIRDGGGQAGIGPRSSDTANCPKTSKTSAGTARTCIGLLSVLRLDTEQTEPSDSAGEKARTDRAVGGTPADRTRLCAGRLEEPAPVSSVPLPLALAAFLDRDGTINREVTYLSDCRDLTLLPGAAEAIARLNRADVAVVVVTNQAGVARGLFPLSRLFELHASLDAMLAEAGAWVDAYYCCPHHPAEGQAEYRVDCACRKPKPGLLRWAARELGLDLTRSVLIGDKLTDLEAGAQAGCRTTLVRTGYGAAQEAGLRRGQHGDFFVADSLLPAVDHWLEFRSTMT